MQIELAATSVFNLATILMMALCANCVQLASSPTTHVPSAQSAKTTHSVMAREQDVLHAHQTNSKMQVLTAASVKMASTTQAEESLRATDSEKVSTRIIFPGKRLMSMITASLAIKQVDASNVPAGPHSSCLGL